MSLAFGIPWTLYLAAGHSITISSTDEEKDADSIYLLILLSLILLFTVVVLGSKVEINRAGAITILSSFFAAYALFIIFEVLSQLDLV